VNRREVITVLGGVAAAWPLAVRAQQPMPVIGLLHQGGAEPNKRFVVKFRQGLRESGYVDGQNVTTEFRWAEGHYDRLPALAADLARRQVTVMVAAYRPAALAAKSATARIPIVFVSGSDPVETGLVASINRPGGNVTGVNLFSGMLASKRLELLRELVPKADLVAVLVNPTNTNAETNMKDLKSAALGVRQRIQVLRLVPELRLLSWTQCPHSAEGDIRAPIAGSGFDPERSGQKSRSAAVPRVLFLSFGSTGGTGQ